MVVHASSNFSQLPDMMHHDQHSGCPWANLVCDLKMTDCYEDCACDLRVKRLA